MAKTRWTGRAAQVQVETTAFTTPPTWTNTVGLTRSITPPPQERASIDLTSMEDTYAVVRAGIEQESAFTFSALHDAEDAVDALIKTLYDSGETRKWRVRRNNGTNWFNSQFEGIVTAIVPQAYGGNDPVQMEVRVHRKSAITHTVAAVTS